MSDFVTKIGEHRATNASGDSIRRYESQSPLRHLFNPAKYYQDNNTIWGIDIPTNPTRFSNDPKTLLDELQKLRGQFVYVAERAQKLLDFLYIEQKNTERYKWLYENAKAENETLKGQLAKLQQGDTYYERPSCK